MKLPGVPDKKFGNQILSLDGDAFKEVLREVHLAVCNVAKGFLLGVTTKRRVPCEKCIQQHPH